MAPDHKQDSFFARTLSVCGAKLTVFIVWDGGTAIIGRRLCWYQLLRSLI